MKCTNCGNELNPGQKFCTKCGAKAEAPAQEIKSMGAQCPNCGKVLNPGQKFCTGCGAPVAQAAPQAAKAPQCPNCGKALNPGQKFCTGCGAQIAQAPAEAGEKGLFSRIGAGIASAATGGSFREGYAQQRDRENEYETLQNMAEYAIKNARAELKKLIKDNKETISYEDEADVNEIIDKIEAALNDKKAEHGDKNSAIKKAVTALQNKMSDLRAKVGGGNSAQQGAQQGGGQQGGGQQGNSRSTSWGRGLDDYNKDELNIVRNKAIWGILPGQIARRITERELDSVDGLNGFIIQEGCEAMIFVNGNLVATMEAGAYNVPQRSERLMKQEFDQMYAEMEKQDKEKRAAAASQKPQTIAERGGLVGMAGGLLRRGWEFIFGATPVKKEKANRENEERMRRLKAEVEKALKVKNPDPIMSIILVSKRNLSLSFGGVKSDKGIDFQPYTIPVGLFDVQMGVMLQLKVTDVSAFATNYLADRLTSTTNDFFALLNGTIENCLRQNLRNVDYQREGLDPVTVENLKVQITNIINQQLFGIECAQILQITDSSADFDRFRNVERELYCAEKELDYLERTGEFRNRLAIETNKQTIQEATNDEDLRYALQQINKDQMLHDDELEQFVLFLNAQKRIREAKSDEDERQAYIDLKKSGLMKDEELEVLKDALEQNKIQRESITEILRIQNMQSVSDARFKAEWALSDMKQDHEWEREDLARRRSWGIEDEERERQWQIEDQELQREMNQDMMRAQHENQMTDVELDTARKLDDYKFENRAREDDYQFNKDERQQDADFNRAQRQRDADWEQRQREEQMRRENEATEYARARQDKFDNADLLEREQRNAMEMMRVMDEGDLNKLKEQNRSAEDKARTEAQVQMNKDNVEATMSAEALMAKQAAQLGGEGQVALAQALGSGKENELLQKQQAEQAKLYQQMLQMQQTQGNQNQQQMMEMVKMMQQGMMGIAGANMANQQAMFNQQQQFQQQRYDDAVAMKNEYRENAMHQQDRMDANQQQALNYTTRAHQTDSQSFAQAMGGVPGGFQAIQQPAQQQYAQQPVQQQYVQQPMPQQPVQQAAPAGKFCPSCGTQNLADEMFCGGCGSKL